MPFKFSVSKSQPWRRFDLVLCAWSPLARGDSPRPPASADVFLSEIVTPGEAAVVRLIAPRVGDEFWIADEFRLTPGCCVKIRPGGDRSANLAHGFLSVCGPVTVVLRAETDECAWRAAVETWSEVESEESTRG